MRRHTVRAAIEDGADPEEKEERSWRDGGWVEGTDRFVEFGIVVRDCGRCVVMVNLWGVIRMSKREDSLAKIVLARTYPKDPSLCHEPIFSIGKSSPKVYNTYREMKYATVGRPIRYLVKSL